ncbi:MAG: class 1 fructose-bisphosphatase [Candidatus Eisenbacteria bacterium]|uniref:Fructose-1,6-bisphosphatase class 1 n=1 Tax=Eiseniibacteriota bacterium TaxID=2212470 RepID=A0A7Y2H1J6_UNCEI|nr:class 1 fructose-bisphosphatase [Candidatus Eisenbacteria bacterium]
MQGKVVTVTRYIMEMERNIPDATGDFSNLLSEITLAGKMIQREVSKAGLVDVLGKTGTVNVQGEEVMKLDALADRIIYQALDHTGLLCVMASEEEEDVLHIPPEYPCGKYVLNYDPLDGSSNIEANVSIGTIFSIHRRVTPGNGHGTEVDCMQPGFKQVAAGYLVYGSSCMLVFTTGQGVHGFTLDPSMGEFLLSHEDIRIPGSGNIYSVNEGNRELWSQGTKDYVDGLRDPGKRNGSGPYKSRYIGSLVADFHRTLLYGGIFLYPSDTSSPQGKLRLLYEAAPLAFIVEQAGGMAVDGTSRRIMDILPDELHQRTPLVIGSRENVEDYLKSDR